jgi:glycosyltransferase involved in cell wall biosynthesis
VRITIVQGPFLPVPAILGGAVEKVWFALGREFARQGHTVTHLSRAHPKLPPLEIIGGVKHERVSGFASQASFGRRMLCDFWYGLRVIPKLPPADILVTNTFWLPALERRRSRGHVYVHVARYPKGQLKLYRKATLQTVSEPIRRAILDEDPSAADRVRVIPYPLSDKYLRPEVGSAGKTLLYTGRVHPEKGVLLLIEAFAQLTEALRAAWKLKIVGPWEIAYGGGGDAYLEELKRAAAPVGAQVEFVGREFDEVRLIEHYRTASVFIYPSLAERGETFGLAVLEAMAAGCAPLVSELACFRDFVRPGENGVIFNHRAAEPRQALGAALTTLLNDAAGIERLRANAWTTARDFTLTKIANQFLADFASLSNAKANTASSPVS